MIHISISILLGGLLAFQDVQTGSKAHQPSSAITFAPWTPPDAKSAPTYEWHKSQPSGDGKLEIWILWRISKHGRDPIVIIAGNQGLYVASRIGFTEHFAYETLSQAMTDMLELVKTGSNSYFDLRGVTPYPYDVEAGAARWKSLYGTLIGFVAGGPAGGAILYWELDGKVYKLHAHDIDTLVRARGVEVK